MTDRSSRGRYARPSLHSARDTKKQVGRVLLGHPLGSQNHLGKWVGQYHHLPSVFANVVRGICSRGVASLCPWDGWIYQRKHFQPISTGKIFLLLGQSWGVAGRKTEKKKQKNFTEKDRKASTQGRVLTLVSGRCCVFRAFGGDFSLASVLRRTIRWLSFSALHASRSLIFTLEVGYCPP